jgi:hypothetical protein
VIEYSPAHQLDWLLRGVVELFFAGGAHYNIR